METRPQIFLSYAQADQALRNELAKQLSLLRRQGMIAGWHDRDINAGQEWAQEIDSHLNTADIILLLVSPDFLASDYCYDLEMARALQRNEARAARVIPIILRPVDWHSAPFGKLKAIPRDGKPITNWANRDEAFIEIARAIRKVIEELTREDLRGPSVLKQKQEILEKDLARYDAGLGRLLEKLRGNQMPYKEALELESGLRENITKAISYGESQETSAERSRLLNALNQLAVSVIGVSFDELCTIGASAKKKRLADLENRIHWFYSVIRQYESMLPITPDARERFSIKRSLDEQRSLLGNDLNEYMNLANQLGIKVPNDIVQILAFGRDDSTKSDDLAIRNVLKIFSESELRLLCFDLGVDYDNIVGEDVEAKALALIDYMKRRSQMEELIAYLRRNRPSVNL